MASLGGPCLYYHPVEFRCNKNWGNTTAVQRGKPKSLDGPASVPGCRACNCTSWSRAGPGQDEHGMGLGSMGPSRPSGRALLSHPGLALYSCVPRSTIIPPCPPSCHPRFSHIGGRHTFSTPFSIFRMAMWH